MRKNTAVAGRVGIAGEDSGDVQHLRQMHGGVVWRLPAEAIEVVEVLDEEAEALQSAPDSLRLVEEDADGSAQRPARGRHVVDALVVVHVGGAGQDEVVDDAALHLRVQHALAIRVPGIPNEIVRHRRGQQGCPIAAAAMG